jgi:hypothetical protein
MSDNSPPTISVSAADVGWRLSRRLVGKSEKGTSFTGDKVTNAQAIIAELNTASIRPLEIGVRPADVAGSTGTYVAGPYKEALSCINELAHGTDGFDWWIEPVSGVEDVIGLFRGAAVAGEQREDVFFEYGVGLRNMRSMGFLRDISTEVNWAYQVSEKGLEPSAENPTPVVEAKDEQSILQQGQYEEVVELSGVNNVALREEWAQENVRVRKGPRRVLSLTSDISDGTARVPKFGVDYGLGDRIRCRAMDEGIMLFNGIARIYSVSVELNNNGTASYTPILVDEGE